MATVTMPPYLLTGLGLAPATFARLVRKIAPARLDQRMDPERFNPREVVAHLADWEPIFRDRMRAAVAQPGAPVEAYDELSRALERRYAAQDVAANLDQFSTDRAETVAWARNLNAEQLDAEYQHPERGVVSVRDTLTMLLGHDAYHVEQLSSYLGEHTAGTW